MCIWTRFRAWMAAGVLLAGPSLAAEPPTSSQPIAGGTGPQSQPLVSPLSTGRTPSSLPALLVMPGDLSAERVSTTGCWAQFYEGPNFRGTQLNILGPVEMRVMQGPFNVEWKKLGSASVGPRARVAVFDDDDFEGRRLVLEPNSRIQDFDPMWGRGWLGWLLRERIESMQVLCVP